MDVPLNLLGDLKVSIQEARQMEKSGWNPSCTQKKGLANIDK